MNLAVITLYLELVAIFKVYFSTGLTPTALFLPFRFSENILHISPSRLSSALRARFMLDVTVFRDVKPCNLEDIGLY